MRHLMVLVVATVGLILGGFAVALAQDATPATDTQGTPCPSPAASPEASPMASPVASPEGTPIAADGCPARTAGAATVDIRDFAYNPNPVTVPAGVEVTWTNQDTVPHTATGQDRDVLQSGTIDPGASYSQAFDATGSYEYFCEFHPNMKATLVVE